MKPGFMSSVCPRQSLSELLATAEKHGYKGIEFRVDWDHGHGVELGASDAKLVEARNAMSDVGVAPTCIATGVKLNSTAVEAHVKAREALKGYMELAGKIGAPYLRVFGDKVPEAEGDRDTALKLAAESCAAVDEAAGEHGAKVLIETHTNMRADWARRIVDNSGAAHAGVLWHIGHHIQRGQSVDDAYPHIQGLVDHVHFSALADSDKVTDADNQRTFDLLSRDGYNGYFSVEVINPEDPEAVLVHHMAKYREFSASGE